MATETLFHPPRGLPSAAVVSGGLTAGRIPFALDADTLDDDADYFWDDTNKTLELGQPTGAASSRVAVKCTKSVASAAGAIWDAVVVDASTLTVTGGTQVTTARGLSLVVINGPTITDSSAVTVDQAATVYISAAPTAGGSVTITNKYALWVDAGTTRLDGTLIAGGGAIQATVAGSPTVMFFQDGACSIVARDSTNNAECLFAATSSGIYLGATTGHATQLVANNTVYLTLGTTGSCILNTGAISTSATNGFLYVAACAGTPTGAPTGVSGRVPVVVDSTNNKLYFYSNGAWRDAGP